MSKKKKINCAADAVEVARKLVVDPHKYKEHFIALYLNVRNQLNKAELVSLGCLTSAIVHPREVFYPAIKTHSASIIVAHNHVSDCLDPSEADLQLTKRLKDAGQILGIELADHIIFDSGSGYKSII